jgi:phosphinothricin acetyltransferase
MKAALTVAPLLPGHWPAVRRIYQEGIDTGEATFETSAPEWECFDAGKTRDCRLVALEEGRVIAWAALTPVSSRPVYRGVAEATLYVAASARGQGVGSTLLEGLIGSSEACGYWTLLVKIFPENTASLALFRKFGFREVGVLSRIGLHHGAWRDVLLIERRAPDSMTPSSAGS